MENPIASFNNFNLYLLTRGLAEKYSEQIIQALDQIPQVERHTKGAILAEAKNDRVLHAKWEHSLIALCENETFAGVIIGYEREKEKNDLYPKNSIYLSDVAVAQDYQKQGLGKFLVEEWLKFNKSKGFTELDGPLVFGVQTNSADWNNHVQKLYESFGFQKIGEKQYNNRTDNVYKLI